MLLTWSTYCLLQPDDATLETSLGKERAGQRGRSAGGGMKLGKNAAGAYTMPFCGLQLLAEHSLQAAHPCSTGHCQKASVIQKQLSLWLEWLHDTSWGPIPRAIPHAGLCCGDNAVTWFVLAVPVKHYTTVICVGKEHLRQSNIGFVKGA